MEKKYFASIDFCCFAILLMISYLLIGFSFHVIDLNKAGLLQNTLTDNFNKDTIYLSGRYWTGLGKKFYTYSTKWTQIKFSAESGSDEDSIETITKNLSPISIECSFWYKLRVDRLHDLYDKYPAQDQHNDYVIRAKNALLKIPQKYSNSDFYSKREFISHEMSSAVHTTLNEVYADVMHFELWRTDLDDDVDSSINNRLTNDLQTETANKNNEIDKIQGSINSTVSGYTTQIKNIETEAQSQSTIIIQRAKAEGEAQVIEAEGNGYQKYLLGDFFSEDDLIQYIWYNNARKQEGAQVTLALAFDKAGNLVVVPQK